MAFLITLYLGERFHIAAFAEGAARCRVFDFLENDGALVDWDRKQLDYLMEKMAMHGAIRNEYHCKHLDDGIFEFKARHGARLLWFYDKDKVVVVSHGFVKKKDKTPKGEIEVAVELRKKYWEAKRHENIRTVASFKAWSDS